jgi:hypothetical protein
VHVPWDDVADQAPPDGRVEAKSLANALMRAEGQVNAIETERMKVNYEYWRIRGLAEPEEMTLEARRLTYLAGDQMDRANLDQAIPLYEDAWKKWREVIDRYPRMAGESVSADELLEDIKRYQKALSFYGKDLPKPFILQDVIDIAEQKITFEPETIAAMERAANRKAEEAERKKREQETKSDKEAETQSEQQKREEQKQESAKQADGQQQESKQSDSKQSNSKSEDSKSDAQPADSKNAAAIPSDIDDLYTPVTRAVLLGLLPPSIPGRCSRSCHSVKAAVSDLLRQPCTPAATLPSIHPRRISIAGQSRQRTGCRWPDPS